MTFLLHAAYVWIVGAVFVGACFGVEWVLVRVMERGKHGS